MSEKVIETAILEIESKETANTRDWSSPFFIAGSRRLGNFGPQRPEAMKKKNVRCAVKSGCVRERDSKGRYVGKNSAGAGGWQTAECGSEDRQKEAESVAGKNKSVNKKKQVKDAREKVYENLPEIVKGLAMKSGNSYLTAKFLFDFAKVEEVSRKENHPGKPESMAGLLEQFGFADGNNEAEEPGEVSCPDASKGEKT